MKEETIPEIMVIFPETDEEFDTLFEIRNKVFVAEQQVPEEDEFDGNDHISHHFLAFYKGEPCGTARWRITPGGNVKMERFAVLKEFRGKGIGKALVLTVLKYVPQSLKIYLHAQKDVIDFYGRLGFEGEGKLFDECGIMHQTMVYKGQKSEEEKTELNG